MPPDRLHSSHQAQIHKHLIEDVTCHSRSEEDIQELMIRLVESLDGQVEFLINSFDIRKCLRSWDVHLDHGTRWSRNIL